MSRLHRSAASHGHPFSTAGRGTVEGSDSWLAMNSANHQSTPRPAMNHPGQELYYPLSTPQARASTPPGPPPAYYPPPRNGQPGRPLIAPDPPQSPPEPTPTVAPPPTQSDALGIDPHDARALAAMFATNALSGDETQADNWYRVLEEDYGLELRTLDRQARAALAIWDGTGRQRVDQAHPGAVIHHDPDHVTVRIRVQITPFTSRGGAAPADRPETAAPVSAPKLPPHAVRSTVPPAAHPDWQGHDAYMLQLAVPVVRHRDDTLAIDQQRFPDARRSEEQPSDQH